MNDPFWYNDVKILFKKEKMKEFYPSSFMSKNEKMNSITRFIIYCGIVLTILKQDFDYLLYVVCFMIIIGIFFRTNSKNVEQPKIAVHNFPEQSQMIESDCTKPTSENPFANVLMNEYTENPDRDPACYYGSNKGEVDSKFLDNIVKDPYDIYNKRHNQRQWHSTANTQIPNDQEAFAHFAFPLKDTCKERPQVCEPQYY